MRQPQARCRVLHTALTSGEPRRALSRRDESTCKLRRLLSTPSDHEVIRAALKGLPLRDRPSWLIEYLVDVNHLPNDPTPQLRKRSTTRAQLASPRPAPFPAILGEPMVSTTLQSDSSEGGEAIAASASPRALLTHTPDRRVPSISLASCAVPALCPTACAVPALCGLDLNENAEVQVAGGAVPTGAGVNASPRAQQYRQEAFDLLAQMGLGQPSRGKELPPPEPPNLHQLPAGFRIVQCSWDDWRLRELNRQFNKEDERVGKLNGPPPRGFLSVVLVEEKAAGDEAVGYVLWRGGLARTSDSVQLQLESAPQLLHFFITPTYRGHRTWRLGQRLLTWWRATHSLHAFIVVEPNAGMHGALRHNGCVSQSVRQGVETSELFTCYPPG